MRIQMRLSKESELILRREKEDYRAKEDIVVTYGWLVNKFVKVIYSLGINKIDWNFVKSYKLNLVNELQANDCEYNTTLNLESTVIQNINTIQVLFKEIFGASRIHKAFVVRMILKSNYLLNKNINIFKEEEKC